MPESTPNSAQTAVPNYIELVRFLIEPFLEQPQSLKVDCEISPTKARVWVRVAFETTDKGRVFGRGGRNIQAVRTVLEAAAYGAGYSAHLDVYGTQSALDGETEPEPMPQKPQPPRRVVTRKLPSQP
jgi:predicted RNA-binding protein YlqC (UPF0109 family)